MTTIMAYAAKRTVIRRLEAWSRGEGPPGPGDALRDVQVAYALPPEPERLCVFGAPVRSSRASLVAEHGVAWREVIAVEIRIRVYSPGDDVEDAERIAGTLCSAVATAVSAEPRLSGPTGTIEVTALTADPTMVSASPEPAVTVNVALVVTVNVLAGA